MMTTCPLGSVVSINPDSIGKNYPYPEIEYIDISSVGSGTLEGKTQFPISEAPSRAKRLVKEGDTILSTVRPNRRSFLYIKHPVPNLIVSTGFAVLRPSGKIDSRFFFYAVTEQKITDYLTANAKGAAYPAVDTETIARAQISLPSIETQRKIASILSAYDDLIENNTRRIKILEEMAQMIYREWFVKFRFPGHEKVNMVDSAMGRIPEGWAVGTFKDLVENRRESTKAGVHLSDRQYVPIECISKKSLTLQEAKPWDEAQSSLILFDKGDILFGAMRPYFHKVTIAPFNGVTRTTCFILRPLAPEYFAYVTLLAFQDETIGYATAHTKGATIPYAVWEGSLGNMMVLIPPCNLLEIFNSTVAPMLKTIQNAFPTLRNLRQTRDLLLPKLISGDVGVAD